MKPILFVLAFTLTTILVHAQPNFDTVKIVPIKISETIYMLKGSGGNIGVLTGPDGVLMIDDQFAPLSEKIKAAIKTLDAGDIKILINTHLHGDHSGGNENFKKIGATIVAQDNVRERMMRETQGRNGVNPPRAKEAWPAITFPDRINFHWNGEDVEVYHFTSGHTDGDAIIKFKNANVFHMGDMFVRYGYPYIDLGSGGSVNGMISFLESILPLLDDKSIIIPGHGELATKADFIAFRDKLKDIRDKVSAALKKGTKVENIASLGITDKYEAEWGKGFVKGKDFVLMVAENLTKEAAKK